jgi:hypothetical protein
MRWTGSNFSSRRLIVSDGQTLAFHQRAEVAALRRHVVALEQALKEARDAEASARQAAAAAQASSTIAWRVVFAGGRPR